MEYVETSKGPPKRTGRPSKYPFEGLEVGGPGRTVTTNRPDLIRAALSNWCKRRGWTYQTEIAGETLTFWRIT